MRRASMFIRTDDILSSIDDAEPEDRHLNVVPDDAFPESHYHRVRKVTWVGSPGCLVSVPVENVLFMEGNQWNMSHARAIFDSIEQGVGNLETPAGRVYRIDASYVKQSTKYEKTGELAYQLGMTRPWTRSDIGSYYVQLLDGNHRAAAAMLAGDPEIVVYVGEGYRENIRKKDWI